MKDSGYDKKITVLLSGHASGVDTLGERWRNQQNIGRSTPIELKMFIPEWDNLKTIGAKIRINDFGRTYNCLAGFDRNQLMVDEADAVVVIITQSSGTEDCSTRAVEKGIPVFILKV